MNEDDNQQKVSRFSDIGEILGILRKRKNIIIWTTIMCALITLFTSVFIISPKYSSSTDILVNRKVDNNNNNNGNDQGQIQTDVQMISTYKDIITSPAILNDAVKELTDQGFEITVGQVRNSITISNQQNSQVFTISVKTNSPQLSAAIANTVASVFKKKVKTIMSVNNVSILSKATVNPSPVSPRIWLNTLVGLIVGFILGLILAFIINGLDRTINDESYITDTLGLNDLGIVSEIPAHKVKKMLSSGHAVSNSSRKNRRV